MVHGTHNALDDPRNEEILVYINGELLPRQDAKISVFDSGYLVGDGVWEGQRLHHGTEVLFFKQMTHHLVELDWGFMREMVNIILTRDPRDMLPSYAQQVSAPSLRDVGYAQHN